MRESQIEIQAIQAKLQALQMGRTAMRQPLTPPSERLEPKPPPAKSAPPSDEATDWAEIDAFGTQRDRAVGVREQLPRQLPLEPRRLSTRETAALLRQLHLPETVEPSEATALQRLEAQIEHINELAIAQESALIELKALAETIERDRHVDGDDEDGLPTCEFLAAAVPLVERDAEGVLIVSTREIDIFRAEREAVFTAKTLRRRRASRPSRHAARHRSSLWDLLKSLFDQPAPTRRSAPPKLTVADAAVWIIGATVARVGLDLLLSAFPQLWLPIVTLIVLPAAIAIYRTTFTPETGFAWGYRLFLVMIGLLLGGRL
jgi:hypothetical protein